MVKSEGKNSLLSIMVSHAPISVAAQSRDTRNVCWMKKWRDGRMLAASTAPLPSVIDESVVMIQVWFAFRIPTLCLNAQKYCQFYKI